MSLIFIIIIIPKNALFFVSKLKKIPAANQIETYTKHIIKEKEIKKMGYLLRTKP